MVGSDVKELPATSYCSLVLSDPTNFPYFYFLNLSISDRFLLCLQSIGILIMLFTHY
jgi:hypothetical protein